MNRDQQETMAHPAGPSQRLKLRVELGRQWLAADDVARLGCGSVIELRSDADGEVDVLAGGRCCARGLLVAVEGLLGVRVTRAPVR